MCADVPNLCGPTPYVCRLTYSLIQNPPSNINMARVTPYGSRRRMCADYSIPEFRSPLLYNIIIAERHTVAGAVCAPTPYVRRRPNLCGPTPYVRRLPFSLF